MLPSELHKHSNDVGLEKTVYPSTEDGVHLVGRGGGGGGGFGSQLEGVDGLDGFHGEHVAPPERFRGPISQPTPDSQRRGPTSGPTLNSRAHILFWNLADQRSHALTYKFSCCIHTSQS